jgi:hypothetical protein
MPVTLEANSFAHLVLLISKFNLKNSKNILFLAAISDKIPNRRVL